MGRVAAINIITNPNEVFFTVVRSGEFKITVKQGCIFSYTGTSKFVQNLLYIGGFARVKRLMIYPSGEDELLDDKGTHIYVDEAEFNIPMQGTTKVWLGYRLVPVTQTYLVSMAADTGEDLYEDPFNPGVDNARAVVFLENDYLSRSTIGYECIDDLTSTDPSMTYILIANITIDEENENVTIDQVHRGILVLNRPSRIVTSR